MSCIIGRFVNGISLNGYEYLLDIKGNVMVFENKENAIKFLKENGYREEEMESFSFLNYEQFENNILEEVY